MSAPATAAQNENEILKRPSTYSLRRTRFQNGGIAWSWRTRRRRDPVAVACRLLNMSTSYYEGVNQLPMLTTTLRRIHVTPGRHRLRAEVPPGVRPRGPDTRRDTEACRRSGRSLAPPQTPRVERASRGFREAAVPGCRVGPLWFRDIARNRRGMSGLTAPSWTVRARVASRARRSRTGSPPQKLSSVGRNRALAALP